MGVTTPPPGGGPYLLGGRGAVGDEHERGEKVDGEAQESDGVGGEPQRDPLEQPGPEELQRRLEQRDARGHRGGTILDIPFMCTRTFFLPVTGCY